MRHPSTGISRGFGFVTFIEQSSRDEALSSTRTTLDGRKIDIKEAISREDMEEIERCVSLIQPILRVRGVYGRHFALCSRIDFVWRCLAVCVSV